MQERLTKLWKTCETKQLANIFKKYTESMGLKKWDGRRKDNSDTYYVDGKDTNWNRVTCYCYRDAASYANHNLEIVLRKRSGSYLIVGKQGKRAFEVDYRGIVHYEEDLLQEIMKEHKELFDTLFKIID